MAPKSPRTLRRIAITAASAAFLSTFGGALPSRALDDGAAPIWTGLGSMIGPMVGVPKDDKPEIEYRERSKLVIPPKMDLPPPGTGLAKSLPVDQDLAHAKKMKALQDNEPSTLPVGRVAPPLVKAGAVVTMSATAGSGPSGVTCLKDGVAVACPESANKSAAAAQPAAAATAGTAPPTKGAQINWNPLTWVGIQKKPDEVLGPEPDRGFLTDPPPGYRAPVEGVGAKIKAD